MLSYLSQQPHSTLTSTTSGVATTQS